MTVRELVSRLNECPPDAKVMITGEHLHEEEFTIEEYDSAFDWAAMNFREDHIMARANDHGGKESGPVVLLDLDWS